MKVVIVGVVMVLMFFLAVYTVKDYLSLPVVAFSYSDGSCKWVKKAPDYEKQECDRIPNRYIMENVK